MPKLIGVTGGSGGGKSYFAKKLIEFLGEENVTLIHLDNYYLEQSELSKSEKDLFNWDLPKAIDFQTLEEDIQTVKSGTEIAQRHYDFTNHSPKVSNQKLPIRPFVVLEGIFGLHSEKIRDSLDFSIFVDAPKELRYARRLYRDQKERGRSEEDIKRQFDQQVEPAYQAYVDPQKHYADLTISSDNNAIYSFDSILQTILVPKN